MKNEGGLTDVDAIRNLKGRYFRLIDTKQWEELASIFTDEAYFDIDDIMARDSATGLLAREDLRHIFPGTGRAVVTGLEPLVGFISLALSNVISVHHGFTAEISLHGDDATAIWTMEDIFFEKSMPHRKIRQAYGHYRDTYRRIGGEWKISSMSLGFIHEEWF